MQVRRPLLRIWDVMGWMREQYGKDYAANSRETIRRQTIHQFEQARLIDRNPDDPQRPTNSGDTVYQLTTAAAAVLQTYGTRAFSKKCQRFLQRQGTLEDAYRRRREIAQIPVVLPNGMPFELSPGAHNELQRLVLAEFAPRFAPGASVLYLGDTARKRVYVAEDALRALHVPQPKHDKLPDLVLFDAARSWLFLVEAVTTHGPVSPKRHAELERALKNCPAGRVYVTAFLDFRGFKKYAAEIAWESEVWVAEHPEHLIHFDGNRFLGPYPG